MSLSVNTPYGLIVAVMTAVSVTGTARSSTNDDLATVMDRAKQHYNAKQYDAAISDYRTVVASALPRSDRARASSRIGYAYLRKGDETNARVAWSQTAKDFSDQPQFAIDACLRIGNLCAHNQELQPAIDAYSKAVQMYSGAPEAKAFAAEAADRLGKMYLWMAENSKRSGGPSVSASAAWDAAAINFDLSRKAFEKASKDFADSGDWAADADVNLVALSLERASYGRGDTYLDVVSLADDFLKKYPNDPVHGATVRLIRAEALSFQGKFDDAIQEIATLQKVDPTLGKEAYGSAQRLLATCYQGKGDYERAITEWQKFLDSDAPSFNSKTFRPDAQLNIGHCLAKLKRYDEAKLAFLKLKRDYPDSDVLNEADRALDNLGQ